MKRNESKLPRRGVEGDSCQLSVAARVGYHSSPAKARLLTRVAAAFLICIEFFRDKQKSHQDLANLMLHLERCDR